MEEERKYIYNDRAERIRKMNRLYIGATIFLGVIFLLYLWMRMANHNLPRVTIYGNTILILCVSVLNTFIYRKDHATMKLKVAATIEMGLEYLLIGMQTDAQFITYVLLILVALQIPYYDEKGLKTTGIGVAVLYVIVTIVQGMKGITALDVDAMCSLVGVLGTLFMIARVGKITLLFNTDALGSVDEEKQKQNEILQGVLGISKTVQEESDKSSSLIGKLVETTNSVTGSMQEITTASGMNANSIEEQNTMTATIQDAIEEASERSKHMVEIAMSSNDSIQENMRVMDALKDQAVQITNTNRDVTEAMTKLQDKTKEVEEIAGMILNISSQTNLLALNASIESARAGEAGRGFAVVAEQIRQLAEQTKNSTEEITRITNELNANANEVVVSVEGSVQATEDQKEKILAASETFALLNKNMGELVTDIEEVNKKVSGLSDSNNKIVVNCSHLSAATEEVTASAEQVHTLSEENLDVARQVQDAVERIHSTADDIKKFLH